MRAGILAKIAKMKHRSGQGFLLEVVQLTLTGGKRNARLADQYLKKLTKYKYGKYRKRASKRAK